MALDRWIALIILVICLFYGYAAFFTMDASLPPFMRRSPIWPSTFPKVLAVLGIAVALWIVLGFEKSDTTSDAVDIDYRRLHEYKLGQALILLGLMVAYALLLRPFGFLGATFGFLSLSAIILGERNFLMLGAFCALATYGVWYLVQEVLGIFLRPYPWFLG